MKKITLIILGLLLTAILLEIGLRLGGFIVLSLQEYRNRISLKQKGTYRILCIGESTTADFGNRLSWPCQLERILNQRNTGIKFSVINEGKAATNTTIIISQLKGNLKKYAPDMIITMMGINDGSDTEIYENIYRKKHGRFIESLKIYKLVNLLGLHYANKDKEIESYKTGGRASSLKQLNDFKEHDEKKLIKSLEVNPENTDIYLDLGECYKEHGKYDEAEKIFKKVIELNPKNDEAYTELGWLYKNNMNRNKAREMFQKAIVIDPKSSAAYRGLGGWYKENKEYEKAIAMFEKALEIDPDDDWACCTLGLCYMYLGKYYIAEEKFRKAIELNPENDRAYGAIAHCYKTHGKYKLAMEYFNKANKLRLESYNPITHYNYHELKEIVTKRGIRLVCMQYPMRSIVPLKKMLESYNDIIFVDNEIIFKKALKQASYTQYFTDIFGGDFGHCTRKGNKLLAENVAEDIIKTCFDK